MNRKSFFKSLLGIAGIGAFFGINGFVKKLPIQKLNRNDEIKQLSDNFYIIRVDCNKYVDKEVLDLYCKTLKHNQFSGIVMPKSDSFESLKDLPSSTKELILKALNS